MCYFGYFLFFMDCDFPWINQHITDDPTRLSLRFGSQRAADILQIECRRRFGTKLRHTLALNPQFIFPSALAGEQSTSDALAAFHASLISDGEQVADLTAGLGIDAMAIARKTHIVTIDLDLAKVDALRINARLIPNLSTICDDCRHWLQLQPASSFSTLFIDPARRAANGGRVYALSDCEPDVTAMLPELRRVANRLIIKASPMLDIAHTLSLLPEAVSVIALGTTTECKELVIICDFSTAAPSEPEINAVTIASDGSVISQIQFTKSEELSAQIATADPLPGLWLYQPYPAVMKAAPMRLLSSRFPAQKLSPQSHIWLSSELIPDFPGHAYRVEQVIPCSSRTLKQLANQRIKASITTSNFPMTADQLRTRLRASDGPHRLFASTDSAGSRILIFTSPFIPTPSL